MKERCSCSCGAVASLAIRWRQQASYLQSAISPHKVILIAHSSFDLVSLGQNIIAASFPAHEAASAAVSLTNRHFFRFYAS